ncbi:hypothetical protein L7F22_053818 [Adiantum nelumboides]|nr:hypothetical protein [Adiantum nelumboides]
MERWIGYGERNLASANTNSEGASCFLQELPEDVLAQLCSSLTPRDLCNLSFTCKKLWALCSSDKLWWPQCKIAIGNQAPSVDLQSWWAALPSYKMIFRFIHSVRPLLGIWVHQNPELGNLVYVTWGFLSVVGCRIIPQELGPKGLETGLLWAPVFEITGTGDGSLAFFLHGREGDKDCCYPGCFNGAKEDCNVLLLEAEPRCRPGSPECICSTAFAAEADDGDPSLYLDDLRRLARPGAKIVKPKTPVDVGPVPFHRLHFADRRKMLDAIARHVRLKIPLSAVDPLFPRARTRLKLNVDTAPVREEIQREVLLMTERRSLLVRMHTHGDPHGRRPPTTYHYNGINSNYLLDKICNPADYTSGLLNHKPSGDSESLKGNTDKAHAGPSTVDLPSSDALNNGGSQCQPPRKQRLAKIIREKMKQIVGMGKEDVGKSSDIDSNTGLKRFLLLQQFARQGDTVALRLHARRWDLKMYRAWPLMPDNRFALYKMPEQLPQAGREHAGLWGGTFGWPPGKPTEDKPGKALYFLLLSYDDTEQGRLLIATKILEGTHYVLHPNGSPMFTANVDEPSSQEFPWHTDKDGETVDIIHAYQGEGIANGYGFRYPSSKPGDLFVEQKGLLAFVWRDSQNVLTLQRLDLQGLLERGDRVAALAPIANYAYLIKSLSNVFAGFCGFGRARIELPTM